jgi:hypothetical protein
MSQVSRAIWPFSKWGISIFPQSTTYGPGLPRSSRSSRDASLSEEGHLSKVRVDSQIAVSSLVESARYEQPVNSLSASLTHFVRSPVL